MEEQRSSVEWQRVLETRDDKIERLESQLSDCEMSLRVYDGGVSEYWLRHPSAETTVIARSKSQERRFAAQGVTGSHRLVIAAVPFQFVLDDSMPPNEIEIRGPNGSRRMKFGEAVCDCGSAVHRKDCPYVR